MSDAITVITKLDPYTPVDARVIILLERAPDSKHPFSAALPAKLDELLGPPAQTKFRAWEITQKLISGEPAFEGVLQLHVMEEIIIRALENILYAIHLDRWLEQSGTTECRFRAPSPYIERLRAIQAVSGSRYSIIAPPSGSISLTQKVKRRIQNKGLAGIGDAFILGARRFFPNAARYLAAMPKARRPRKRGGWWFYSTAYTFTNIGLAYEPYLPHSLNYLVDSSETGDAPLRERGREFFDIYAWASTADLPGKSDLANLRRKLLKHIASASLDREGDLARTALLQSDVFKTYLERILPLTCFHSRILARFLDEVSPEAIIVGNAAFEGPLLQLARSRGIPTVLLQHGILGDYYQLMDQPAATLLVRGEFWKEFVAGHMRERTRILNIPRSNSPSQAEPDKPGKILFLTSVDAALTHTHESDLRDILERLLHVSGTANRTLIVRVHPMETVGYYRAMVERVSAELKLPMQVEYSQGAGLDSVLANTAVAVTYSSTVFLDCLRHGIPIISFDWHDFAYKSLIEQHKVFYFARDLADLESLAERALNGELPVSKDYDRFLAPTSKIEWSLVSKSLAQPSGE
jgi:hypothetical protein